MVSARRHDHITRREFPIRRRDAFNRNPLLRRRLFRDGLTNSRTFFIDRDEIPQEITQALDERQETSYNLAFAPLTTDESTDVPADAIPAGEELNDESSSTTSGISDCPTIEVDLDNPTVTVPPGLLSAWERNAEIRRTTDRKIQVPSPMSDALSAYSTPNYSPVRPEEFPLDWSPEPISPIRQGFEDDEVNRILDYLNSEEFLDEIVELYIISTNKILSTQHK